MFVRELPASERPLLLRTAYGDEPSWRLLCELIERENEEGFKAFVEPVSDPAFEGAVTDILKVLNRGRYRYSFLFLADEETLTGSEHLVLAVHLDSSNSARFRIPVADLWAAENNLSLANLDFDDFVQAADEKGVYRVESN